jgi:type II secretory pathway pseudopilin PulG
MSRRAALGVLRDSRGFSIVELMLGTLVFFIIAAALASLYVSTKQAFDLGSSQAYVQRQGTLIQERIARLIGNAQAVQVVDCGPNSPTNGTSVLLLDATGTARCIYQSTTTADANADLMLCQAGSFSAGATCSDTAQNMLNLMQSEVAARLGAQLRVRNLAFSQVTCVQPGGICVSNPVGRWVVTPLVDVTFDLTDGTIFNPNYNGGAFSSANFLGMRFGFSVTARN